MRHQGPIHRGKYSPARRFDQESVVRRKLVWLSRICRYGCRTGQQNNYLDDEDLDNSFLGLRVTDFNWYHPLWLFKAKVQKRLNHLEWNISQRHTQVWWFNLDFLSYFIKKKKSKFHFQCTMTGQSKTFTRFILSSPEVHQDLWQCLWLQVYKYHIHAPNTIYIRAHREIKNQNRDSHTWIFIGNWILNLICFLQFFDLSTPSAAKMRFYHLHFLQGKNAEK